MTPSAIPAEPVGTRDPVLPDGPAHAAGPGAAVRAPLRLFTVFHGNLDFSALPDRDLPLVIARCYWPLLELASGARVPLGVEMPARTLARVAREDPEWMKTFRELAERGLVEPVASGLGQVIGPLVPADVNRDNLAWGREAYGELLGFVPDTWFVNEQTFSRGLAALYHEAGARRLVVEWNNPASHDPRLRPLRHAPARLAAGGDATLAVLWNDSVVFQKLQRAVHGETPAEDYLRAVWAARGDGRAARALCAYGGDLEIFDYRPGRPAPRGAARGAEMRRLARLLAHLAAHPDVVFRRPRDVWSDAPPGPVVELTGAADPIPCKKQPRYNPTRWAVSGRDGAGMNTRCFALRRALRCEAGLGGDVAAARRELVQLWGSDFRTRATEERVTAFHARMGVAQARARARLERALPPLGDRQDVLLVNASDRDWRGEPVEIPVHLPPGRLAELSVLSEPADALPEGAVQVDVHGRYRDGSVRRALLVLEPRVPAGGRLDLRLVPTSAAPASSAPRGTLPERLATPTVEAGFWHHRGGALASLAFPGLGGGPILGTVAHGTYEDIAYTPDYYSGHVVAVTEDGRKLTDLSRPEALVLHEGPLRITAGFRVRTPVGDWTKVYRLYRHHPRLDLVHALSFHEARLASLRLGTVTCLPGAWAPDGLAYATVNGGREAERFALEPGVRIAHHEPVPGATSARGCLGATEGWVSLGDGRRGVAVIGDRSQAAAAPLLECAEVDGGRFLRLHHTLAETDETRATFFRGFRRVAFAIVGHRDDLAAVRESARAIEDGIAYRTEHGVGIARGV